MACKVRLKVHRVAHRHVAGGSRWRGERDVEGATHTASVHMGSRKVETRGEATGAALKTHRLMDGRHGACDHAGSMRH